MLKQDEFFSNYGKAVKKKEGIPGLKMNKPLAINTLVGTIGLELEIECRNNLPRDHELDTISPGKTSKTRWMAVRDGSLRGNSMEYIFSGPCTRDELPTLVKDLFKKFKDYGSLLDNSNRCSTHVHINMAGKTINQLTSILSMWAIFEEALIDWCGEERKTNHFCLSMQDSSSVLAAWERFLRHGSYGTFDRNLKYSALNVLPIFDKGSFEFRCGRASDEPTFPITWATFLDTLVEFTSDRYVVPARIANDMSERGAHEIFMDICKDKALADFKNDVVKMAGGVEAFNDKCFKGFRNVQALILGFPWDKWIELIDKTYVPNPFEKPSTSKSIGLATAGRARPTGWGQPATAPDRLAIQEEAARIITNQTRTIRPRLQEPPVPEDVWREVLEEGRR